MARPCANSTLPFGATGHVSSRVVFGAAALFESSEAESQHVLELLLHHGINHIDCAASYGDAELWVGRWMEEHRKDFFLATKTGERRYDAAREQIRKSLERLRVDQIDLIQLHNLVKDEEWEVAFSQDGALRAAVEARDEGLVRFIGVTGHGTRVARIHRKSIERFAFDSLLLPCNFMQLKDADYAREFAALLDLCAERNVAVQTIKSIARRRWDDAEEPTTTTWYRALESQEDISRAVAWVLSKPGIFLNTASDVGLLERTLKAADCWFAAGEGAAVDDGAMLADAERLAMAPLFIHGHRIARA